MTLDAQVPAHVMGQHTGKITGVGIVARGACQGFSGSRVDRILSNGMGMLQISDILMAAIAEFVDLQREEFLEFGAVGIVTFRTSLGDRTVELLSPEDTIPVVADEADPIPFLQKEVFAVTEVGIVAARALTLSCQRFV